jgi:hypothetical protein
VERLWGALAGTPGGDRLDILATLIASQERQHYPMAPSDPVEAIKFRKERILSKKLRCPWATSAKARADQFGRPNCPRSS